MSKTKITMLATFAMFTMFAVIRNASCATIDQLVAKQRQIMEQEIDKKLNAKNPPCASPITPPTTTASTLVDDLHVNAIYGINSHLTVDVSIGNGPSFPLTPGRILQGWSITSISEAAVTFRHSKSGRTKTIYLSSPITHAEIKIQRQAQKGRQIG